MKLTGIQIDGFGVWRDLHVADVGEGVTVLYGPNEAGKTTVLQFIRTILYGASAGRRGRYLPPVEGGAAGGRISVQGPTESLVICRRFDPQKPAADRLQILGANQQPRDAGDLAALLGGIDEPTFNNVYAVGLRELQELGTLSDTEAAGWLYSLTTGLDRVSLLDVMQQLEHSREELLARDGSGGLILSLFKRRDALAAQIEQQRSSLAEWSLLHVRLEQLAHEIRELHDRQVQVNRENRTLEIALQLAPRWREREELERQLSVYRGRIRLPDDAAERLDALQERIAGHDRDAEVLKRQRQVLREEADALGINEVLVRNASRVEALGEQKDWLEALQRQAAAIRTELSEIQSQLATEDERLGADLASTASPRKRAPEITEGVLNSLRPHAKAIRVCRARLQSAERDAETKREAHAEYEAQLQIATPAASEGMPTDLEEAGELVAALKRRLQVEQRLGQARRQEVELAQQTHELLDRQELPIWIEGSHTVLIIIGVGLFAIGLLAGASAAAWIGGVMLAVLLALRIFKYVSEEQVSDRREGLDRQIELVQKQIQEAQREQMELEDELGPVEGSLVVKVQAAERHLAELEKLLPIDSKLRDARREAESSTRRVEEARRRLEAAEATWRGKLSTLGLPKDWTPRDLRTMAGRYEQISELRTRVARRREDAEQRQREYTMLCERIHHLAEEVGLAKQDADAADLLGHLLSELRGHQTKLAERDRLRKRARELKTKQARHARAAAALRQRRDSLFHQAGAEDEAAYRNLIQQQRHADKLRRQTEMLTREIAAAIGGHGPEDLFAKLLDSETAPTLEARREETSAELGQIVHEMHRFVEERGAIGRQLEELAADRSLAEYQLELGEVEAELEEAIAAWRVRAATCTVLERIRVYYEQHRQPETLIEASRLFEKLTGGRYRRVWTPLGKSLLFADTQEGEALPVDVLSRGTREQLFLALRLALVSLFARRGVGLPIVLDDVFVNFDARRAARAAEAVRDFAEAGHQILVFTCHEHVAKLFGSLGVDVRQLPDRFGEEPVALPTPRATRHELQPEVVDLDEADEQPHEVEVQIEPEDELQLEPPLVPPVPYSFAVTDEDDEEEYEIARPAEEEVGFAEDEEELALEEDEEEEDTILDVVEAVDRTPPPKKAQSQPRLQPPEVEILHRDDHGEWIRIGPQVRRRELVEAEEDTMDEDDYEDDDEFDDEWYEEDDYTDEDDQDEDDQDLEAA